MEVDVSLIEKFVYTKYGKYSKDIRDELISVCWIFMLERIHTYDPSKGTPLGAFYFIILKNFAFNHLRRKIFNYRMRDGVIRKEQVFQFTDTNEFYEEDYDTNIEFDLLTRKYNPQQLYMIKKIFSEGLTVTDLKAVLSKAEKHTADYGKYLDSLDEEMNDFCIQYEFEKQIRSLG